MDLIPLNILLTNASPKADTLTFGNLTLRPHQAATLQRCIDLESGAFPGETRDLDIVGGLDVRNVRTRIGAICIETGGGKSAVVIALCMRSGEWDHPESVYHHSLCGGRLTFEIVETRLKDIHTNVVVVPHGIVSQWVKYIDDMGVTDRTFVLNRRSQKVMDELSLHLLDETLPQLVLCSSTCYNTLANMLANKLVRVRRLIFDEADTISLECQQLVPSHFTWCVTASVESLLVCDVNNTSWYSATAYRQYMKGINSRAIRELWKALQVRCDGLRCALIARSTDQFLKDSLGMEEPTSTFVACTSPVGARVLHGLIDEKMMQALNTDDLPLALSYVQHRGDSENIAASLTNSWRQNLTDIRVTLSQLQSNTSPHLDAFKKSIARQAEALEKWIATVKERVESDDLCPVCYEHPRNKCVMQCCSATYCFECAANWVSRKGTCGSCRRPATTNTMHVITDQATVRDPVYDPIRPKKESCVSLVRALLERNDSARVLVCCSNSNVFDDMRELYRHGVCIMKGSGATINKAISRFEKGVCRIMCVASDCYSSGVNLPMVTDVILFNRMSAATEKQVIGRAQRPGRTSRLNVWYLVQHSETGFDGAGNIGDTVSGL